MGIIVVIIIIHLGPPEVDKDAISGVDHHPITMEGTLQDPTPATPKLPQRPHRKKNKKKMGQLNTGLFNLARVQVLEEEMEVLAQGLKFAPDKNLDKFKVIVDVEKNARKLNIKHYAGIPMIPPSDPTADDFLHSGLKNKSEFHPKKRHSSFY